MRRIRAGIDRVKQIMGAIFSKPASVTVFEGKWKTGKTNTALYFAQLLKHWGFISDIGSNIEVYKKKGSREIDESHVKFINNFLKLKSWGFGSNRRKLFIFDEAMKNAPSREAMTKLNKAWLDVIPEASKMRMHILAITQEDEYLESIFKNETFRQAHFYKPEYSKTNPLFRKVVILKAKSYFEGSLEIYPVPETTLIYDPYLSATMSLEPTSDDLINVPLPVRIAFDYSEESTSTSDLKIKYELPTRKQVTREIKRGLKMLKKLCLVSNDLRWVDSEGEVTQVDQS